MESEKRPDPFTPTSTLVSLSPIRIAATHRCFAVRNGAYAVFSKLIYYQNMPNYYVMLPSVAVNNDETCITRRATCGRPANTLLYVSMPPLRFGRRRHSDAS